MSGIELKRCPFCGMPPEIGRIGDKYTVQCVNPECPAVVCTMPLDTEKDAAEAWNNIKVPTKAGGVMKYEQFAANARNTYDDFCEIGGALSRAKSVLAAVPDLVGKNERLEKENRELKKENAELKAELDDWKGNAEGFHPDAYMKLPLDADGVPIRIGDKMDVDGDCMTVLGYHLFNGELLLMMKKMESDIAIYTPKPSDVRHFKYAPPDSWEKLEEDASVGAQDYCANCLGIDIRKTLTSDDDEAFAKDIIRRAKKLAGIDMEAE